jgi:hypothetical protein
MATLRTRAIAIFFLVDSIGPGNRPRVPLIT